MYVSPNFPQLAPYFKSNELSTVALRCDLNQKTNKQSFVFKVTETWSGRINLCKDRPQNIAGGRLSTIVHISTSHISR